MSGTLRQLGQELASVFDVAQDVVDVIAKDRRPPQSAAEALRDACAQVEPKCKTCKDTRRVGSEGHEWPCPACCPGREARR